MVDIIEVKDINQINKVVEIADKIWNEHYTPIIGKEQVDYMLSKFQSAQAIKAQINDGYRYFLATFKDNSVGYFAILSDENEKTMLLSKLYVDKDFRRCGIAKMAVAYIENICKNSGNKSIWLTVNKENTDSIAAYERMGFINKGPIVQHIGGDFLMDDYKMVKEIYF